MLSFLTPPIAFWKLGPRPLPANSLHGEKRTLAMNYKLIASISKNFDIKGGLPPI